MSKKIKALILLLALIFVTIQPIESSITTSTTTNDLYASIFDETII